MNKIQQPLKTSIQGSAPAFMQDDVGGVELARYISAILNHLWLIAGIAFVVSLFGIAYAFMDKPVYESNMLIHVEEEATPSQSKNILGEMASTFDVKTSAISEMELIRSRLVVSTAVDNLQLYIDVQPKYFPIIGAQIADRNKQLSNPGLFGYGGYAWGDEKIDILIFNVPDSFLNQEFVITAEENGQFRLNQREKNVEWKGQIGTTLTVQTEKGTIELRVKQIAAKPGAQFLLRRASRLTTIEDVQKSMTITEQGKQSGVINVTLKGNDPQLSSRILSEISQGYMNQNQARKTEEAEKSLSFLDKQLPELRQQLEHSEFKYNQFRNSHGTIDLSEEAKLILQQSAVAKTKRLELQQKRTELLTRFTSAHHFVIGINSQISEMNGEIKSIADRIKQLPMLEQELLSLSRDIKVNTDLYTALLNTAQQLRLITAGKVSNVRLVDAPMMPENPIRPRARIITFSVLIGLLLGVISAILKKSLNNTIDDPDQIEHMFGVPVHATIPHSKKMNELNENVSNKSGKAALLARISSTDIAIESLRTFCTTLQFSISHAKNNIVLITGATPGLGKTFVSANLASIMAKTGKKVLLIDADLRNGHLHHNFGLTREDGLSDFLSGTIQMERVVHREVMEHIDFISTGSLPVNPSELLLRPGFGELLQSLSNKYDLVIIDTTPILALSDTLAIGSHAGVIYMMARAGSTTAIEIKESMKRLSQAGLSVRGILFNDAKSRQGRYGYGYPSEKYRKKQYLLKREPVIGASSN